MKLLKIFTLIACMIIGGSVFAQKHYTKPVRKAFLAIPNSTLKISNKYGNVRILQSQADSIVINTTVSISQYDDKIAEKQLDEISIIFGNYKNVASAKTEISKHFKTGYKFSIDYIVTVPEGIKLNIDNSFGDIIAEGDLKNLAELTINYGNIYVDNLIPVSESNLNYFKLNYSTAHLKMIHNSKVLTNFSKIRVKNADNLVVSSRCSRIEVDSTQSYSCNTQNDNCIIKYCESFNINKGDASHVTIENGVRYADINTKGGSISINNVNDFKKLSLSTEKTNVNININDKVNYALKASFTDTKYSFPESLTIFSQNKDEFSGIEVVEAIFGNRDAVIDSTISLEAIGGFISIK